MASSLEPARPESRQPAPGRDPRLRLAIVSTPRCGNTWLRYLVSSVYDVAEMAVHQPDDVDWGSVPSDVVVQLHWHRVGALRARLADEGFKVVSLARHPLDVLISILHFAPRARSTIDWLRGEAGDESALVGAGPASPAFLDWALGARAEALLSVSAEWWEDPSALQIRYENLVEDPVGSLRQLIGHAGMLPVRSLREAVQNQRFDNWKASNPVHFWKGQPGLWRRVLLAGDARAIAARHERIFATLGYTVDADDTLTADTAERNWVGLG